MLFSRTKFEKLINMNNWKFRLFGTMKPSVIWIINTLMPIKGDFTWSDREDSVLILVPTKGKSANEIDIQGN